WDGGRHLGGPRPATGYDASQVGHLVAQDAHGIDDRVLPVPIFDGAVADDDELGLVLQRGRRPASEHRIWISAVQHYGDAVCRRSPLDVPLLVLIRHSHRMVSKPDGALLDPGQDAG